ncbi:hypothetical protein FRC00_006688 [Tulasnella sp. 408]|nr:hypothetical protein FRC00_006688 [Tulasnella sp. 408]
MTQPTQVLPYWLSASTTFVTTEGTVFPTTVVVNLPLTYYGPSIPLGPGWTYGGSTSPPPGATLTSATDAASSVGTETPSPSASELTSGASETGSASISPSSFATSSGIPISVSSGATPASSVPSTSPPESSASASPSSVTGPLTSTPSISLSTSSITPTSRTSASAVDACTTLFGCPTSTSTSTPTTTPTAESSNSRKLSTGAIVAIALVSAIAAAILLACCIVIFLRRRRRRSPNHGSPLEGNISALPPPLGEEHGSLLAGRRSGGESPDLEGDGATTVYRDAPAAAAAAAAAADDEVRSEEEDLTRLPIANKYITQRRSSDSWASRPNSRAAGSLKGRDAERGAYHAVGDTEAAAEVAGVATVAAAAGAAATVTSAHQAGQGSGSSASHAHTHSSRGLFHASGASNGEEHHRAPSPTSGGSHENAEVVTAQRATRSPLARLARLSWFARNRNTAGSSMAATGLHTDSDEEAGWVNLRSTSQQMRERGGQPLTTPLLSQPPSGGGRVPIVMRQAASRSNTALVDPPQSPPPPVAFFNVPRSRSAARRSGQSGRSSQSGQTVFFDAEEEPTQAPAPAFMPRTSTDAPAITFTPPGTAVPAVQPQRSSLPASGSESSRGEGGPTPADFPVPPAVLSPSLSFQWPQFRNSDSQNNDSASLSATTESPIPPGQALPGLFSRSLSGVGMVGAPILASRGDTLDPPVAEEERRRHASAPNLREQALAAEENSYRGRLSTLAESTSDSWRARALSPVAASAAAAISGASGGDERSRRLTLGPVSSADWLLSVAKAC